MNPHKSSLLSSFLRNSFTSFAITYYDFGLYHIKCTKNAPKSTVFSGNCSVILKLCPVQLAKNFAVGSASAHSVNISVLILVYMICSHTYIHCLTVGICIGVDTPYRLASRRRNAAVARHLLIPAVHDHVAHCCTVFGKSLP